MTSLTNEQIIKSISNLLVNIEGDTIPKHLIENIFAKKKSIHEHIDEEDHTLSSNIGMNTYLLYSSLDEDMYGKL